MKCPVCEHNSDLQICTNCGHDISGSDTTTSLHLDEIADAVAAPIDLTELAPEQAVLVVVRGAAPGEIWSLDSDRIEVGRSQDAGLFLDDVTVSRHHAVLTRDDSVWTIEDKGSLNGSYVNRNLISTPTVLKSGDELQIGKYRFTFSQGSDK